MSEDVIIRRIGRVGHITLSRPRALHALTQAMCEAISTALLAWQTDDAIDAVLLDHAPETRGFCAGGDVAMVRRSVLHDGGTEGRAFFLAEYRMNHLLFTFPKPIVACMDGVTMGGGVGLALPCRYRIATENTLFAMPEGAIGLFPDVGAGWYLPQLPHRIGVFLALTGARLDGAECLWSGLATHYLPSTALEEARQRIIDNPQAIGDVLASLAVTPPPARLAGNAERIERLFGADTLEGIIDALKADDSKWAGKELKAVTAKCPTSSKVALRLQTHRRPDFAAEMALEYRLACRMISRCDFTEGVRAVLVDKDNLPSWVPAEPENVTDAMLDALFEPLPADEEWTPLSQ